MRLRFHPLIPKDLRRALSYYEEEAGSLVATRFQEEFDGLSAAIMWLRM